MFLIYIYIYIYLLLVYYLVLNSQQNVMNPDTNIGKYIDRASNIAGSFIYPSHSIERCVAKITEYSVRYDNRYDRK